MKVERTHDKLYLDTDYKRNPKEYYKFVKNQIVKDNNFNENSQFALLDIGCETGSFLYFMKKNFLHSKLTGMDVMSELLEKVNDMIEEEEKIETIKADISKIETLPIQNHYDIITMLGVLSIFDNYAEVIDNVLTMCNNMLYIFGIFNPKDIDVLIKARNVNTSDLDNWESGWNYISKCSIEKYCSDRNLQCEFIPFYLDIDIPENIKDPFRSWTVNMADNKKMVINGIQIVHHFYLVKIKK